LEAQRWSLLPEEVANNVVVPWFDLQALEDAYNACDGDVAGFLWVCARAVITASVVTSEPFFAKNAQSAEATVFTRFSAHSTITFDGEVVQLPSFICFIAAASTSG